MLLKHFSMWYAHSFTRVVEHFQFCACGRIYCPVLLLDSEEDCSWLSLSTSSCASAQSQKQSVSSALGRKPIFIPRVDQRKTRASKSRWLQSYGKAWQKSLIWRLQCLLPPYLLISSCRVNSRFISAHQNSFRSFCIFLWWWYCSV
jgi:hypothetical protein